MSTKKFRAWDKEGKRMRNGGFWVGSDFGEVYTVALETPIEELNKSRAIIERDSSLIPMQFTGLTDKNGKEVYEGDIVKVNKKYHNHNCVYSEVGTYANPDTSEYEIIPADAHFPYTAEHNSGYGCSILSEHCEVIGNIYESGCPYFCKHSPDEPHKPSKT